MTKKSAGTLQIGDRIVEKQRTIVVTGVYISLTKMVQIGYRLPHEHVTSGAKWYDDVGCTVDVG